MKGTVRLIVSAALGALATAPAEAGANDAAILEIVDRAVAQWSVFLSCSILEPPFHADVLRAWQRRMEDLDAALAGADLAPEAAAAIAAAVDPETMMAPARGDLAALVTYCNAVPDWHRTIAIGRDVVLPGEEIMALPAAK